MHPLSEDLAVVGLNPTIPQYEAGILMLPAPSDDTLNGTHPIATSAASPPEDPPGVLLRFHGLFVLPQMAL
jgi:hypothetical protein